MKFGKRAESSFNELHATGLVPFPYKSFKKMIKLLSHERPNATCPTDVDVRESFLVPVALLVLKRALAHLRGWIKGEEIEMRSRQRKLGS